MSATVFNQIGPFAILRELGQGGMARVFLATDTRSSQTVALKVVRDGPEADAREILEAEVRGADLQREFSQASQYVPRVFDVGYAPGYFYIAMEYVDGDDLSAVLRGGALAPARAVSIASQLCQFLEEVDRAEAAAGAPGSRTLLHNDLKPSNVRLISGDRVKVLDFGAAKALSLSRRVTRNSFGSIAYLSPECLETGLRDRRTDAWALGVMLYEMLAGHLPFRAPDESRLEQLIRARRPPEPLSQAPAALQAVVAKLLAPDPADRYERATEIRSDLEKYLAGNTTRAEAEGWPRAVDEQATRRTQGPSVEDQPTRRTHDTPEQPATPVEPVAPAPPARSKPIRRWRRALLFLFLFVTLHEGCIALSAQRVSVAVPMLDFDGVAQTWSSYDSLRQRSWLFGLGTQDLGLALVRQSVVLADQVIGNYRTPQPSVREAQWESAVVVLRRALTVVPEDADVRAAMRYSEGHLRRIDGEAARSRGQATQAQRHLAEAVTAFREAATLRPGWADPFLGLARTFIYGLDDIDRGHDAINQAQKFGYAPGSREFAQLAHGYFTRGETLERAAAKLRDTPQEREQLTRAADAYKRALEQYAKIADTGDTPTRIRAAQERLDRVERQLGGWRWPWG